MGNLIDEIKAIKNSANWYYQMNSLCEDKNYSKYGIMMRIAENYNKQEEYYCLLREYKKAVKWMRMSGVEIDTNVS